MLWSLIPGSTSKFCTRPGLLEKHKSRMLFFLLGSVTICSILLSLIISSIFWFMHVPYWDEDLIVPFSQFMIGRLKSSFPICQIICHAGCFSSGITHNSSKNRDQFRELQESTVFMIRTTSFRIIYGSWYLFVVCRRGHDHMVVGFTTTYMLSVPITTDVVSSNLDQDEVYNLMWKSLSMTCDRSVVFSGSSGFLHH